jgi:hypothetical protein
MEATTTDLTTPFNPSELQLLCHDLPYLPFFDTMFDAISGGGLFNVDDTITSLPPKASVEFHHQMEVWEIPSAKELSKKEKEALWYADPTDRAERNSLHLLLCRSHAEGESSEEEEELVDEMREPSQPVSAVLSEQQNQREEGWYDPEAIAMMYHQFSSHSQKTAQMKAIQDETEIREYISTAPSSRRIGQPRSLLPSFLRLKSRPIQNRKQENPE